MTTDRLTHDLETLPWAHWPWQRCKARAETGERCDLRKHHGWMYHALERGMYIERWSTRRITDA